MQKARIRYFKQLVADVVDLMTFAKVIIKK